MPPKTVPDDGSLDAQLVVVGEAPSTVEVARRRPFVGPSGGKLAEWWKRPDVNIQRRDVYITNVIPYMVQKIPRGGVHGIDITVQAWNEAVTELHARLAALSAPSLIVAVGDIALQALRGHGGVLKWRGSLLVYEPLGVRLLPTVHPAALFRDPSLERRCIADWQKIAKELRNPSPETWKEAKHHIAPSFHQVQSFRRAIQALSKADTACHLRPRLTVDIETPRKMQTVAALTPKLKKPTTKKVPGRPFIGCIGFALSPDESITIPTMPAYWKQYGVTMEQVWQEIAAICESRLEKVLQNGFFDAFYLARDRGVHKALGRGIRLRNYKHDTLAKHHVLDASEEHSLAYINSIYGRHPYWKDDGKQPGDLRGVPPDLEKWWLYNGTDATETHYLDARLDEAMTPEQRQFYKDHYQKCFAPILDMMTDGICVDEEKRAQRFAELRAKVDRLRQKINDAAQVELMGTKSISSTKLKTYLYETLKLPKQFAKNAKKEKVVSAGEIQLKRLMNLFPKHEQLQRVGRLVLKFRRADKLSTFYAEKIADSDGRARCTYTFETDTGRLSSRQNPMGGGANHQNPDGSSLDIYVADPGGIFIECDLSQAESRLVYVFTGDPELIEVARTAPWEYDSHTVNTANILGIPESEVTKEQRKNIGKPTAHAAHYMMMGATMSDSMLRHGVVMTPEECQGHIDAYMTWRHQVPVWQQRIKWEVIDKRQLTNSWGRVADFRYMRLQPHLYQKACNFKPQSEVAGLINQYGMIPIRKAIRVESKPHRLRLQKHDSLAYWSPWDLDNVWWIIQTIYRELERPRVYDGVELTIPVGMKCGLNLGEMVEFKKPPTKREVRQALEQLRENVR